MKKVVLLFLVLCFTLSLVSISFAGDTRRGTIKDIDIENNTIVFCPEGTEDSFKMTVDPDVDLKQIKKDTKVQLYVEGMGEKEEIKAIKKLERTMVIGC